MSKAKLVSLSSLNATKACDVPHKFDYIDEAGNKTGVVLHVIGSESAIVVGEISRQTNEARKKEVTRRMNQTVNGSKKVEFETLEDQIDSGRKLASARLVGWEGIEEEYTPERGLELCMSNKHICAAINTHSDDIGNFIKL